MCMGPLSQLFPSDNTHIQPNQFWLVWGTSYTIDAVISLTLWSNNLRLVDCFSVTTLRYNASLLVTTSSSATCLHSAISYWYVKSWLQSLNRSPKHLGRFGSVTGIQTNASENSGTALNSAKDLVLVTNFWKKATYYLQTAVYRLLVLLIQHDLQWSLRLAVSACWNLSPQLLLLKPTQEWQRGVWKWMTHSL